MGVATARALLPSRQGLSLGIANQDIYPSDSNLLSTANYVTSEISLKTKEIITLGQNVYCRLTDFSVSAYSGGQAAWRRYTGGALEWLVTETDS